MSDRPLMLTDLQAGGACKKETQLFIDKFGEGNEATYERVMSVALTFDWMFAARHLLSDAQQRYFRAQIVSEFRNIRPDRDADKSRRKRAMAKAFWLAWNSRED